MLRKALQTGAKNLLLFNLLLSKRQKALFSALLYSFNILLSPLFCNEIPEIKKPGRLRRVTVIKI
jgi:hypothetical protein